MEKDQEKDEDRDLMDFEETPTPTRSVADLRNNFEQISNATATLPLMRHPNNNEAIAIRKSQRGSVVSSSAESASSFFHRQNEMAVAKLNMNKSDTDSNSSDEYYYISEDDEEAIAKYNQQLALKVGLKKPSYLDSVQFSQQNASSSASIQCRRRNPNEHHQASDTSSRSFQNFQQQPSLSVTLGWSSSSSSSYASVAAAGGSYNRQSSHSSPPLTPAASSKIPDPNQELFQLENGIHLPNNFGPNKKMTKVHEIYKRKKDSSVLNSIGKAFTSGPTFEMLLWLKTTPESVRKLAEGKDTCIAFYDRLCRALPRPIKEMRNGWRELILLCKVDVGKMYKSPHGYSRWHLDENGPPRGSDSVKGNGKFIPNWDQNVKVGNKNKQIVPCGQTVMNARYRDFLLEFNEYLIFHAKQIEVMFAVDVEICEAVEEKNEKTRK
ncbi:uncharacterized protein LOC110853034 isoform X3 [Folsomia candida]|uniref:uncharacterized protein LOC110853034 isoform X3 n=1 Tax=Folsomia candida TaxID=158441 RepID=UPI000B90570B|nr:uncharacterized protein LOC110853034 isoform X3 [Folsomia candida]